MLRAPEKTKRSRGPKLKSVRPTRERLEVDERRAQLVRLGIDLFAARAYDEVSIDELARAAGVSKGLLYHYFPTKRDFYVATVREASRQLVEFTATAESVPPVERLRVGLDAYLDYVDAHGPAYAALMRGGVGSDPEVARIIDETRALLCDRLLSELPEVTPTPVVRIAVRGWLGFCEATSLEWLDDRAVPREAIRDLMQEVLLATVPIAVRVALERTPALAATVPDSETPRVPPLSTEPT
jgi:AcrR family transcriptional regulator